MASRYGLKSLADKNLSKIVAGARKYATYA